MLDAYDHHGAPEGAWPPGRRLGAAMTGPALTANGVRRRRAARAARQRRAMRRARIAGRVLGGIVVFLFAAFAVLMSGVSWP